MTTSIATAVSGILTARTLANSHPTLLRLLRPGMSVLDVGCGPGTLTVEIARRVDPGRVVAMDASREMIRVAEDAAAPDAPRNLIFSAGDIRASAWDREFDLVNAARTLLWIPGAAVALRRMARAAAPGAAVVVLDDDHTRCEWSDPPRAWTRFFDAFLGWREARGFDNAIAGRLADLATVAGLRAITLTPQMTTVRTGDPDFFRVAGRWRMIIEDRGREMVAAGYLAESERRRALEDYTGWMKRPQAVHTVHEACLVARRP